MGSLGVDQTPLRIKLKFLSKQKKYSPLGYYYYTTIIIIVIIEIIQNVPVKRTYVKNT